MLCACVVRNECQADDHGNTPCQNGGSCTDLVKEYVCSCVGNYEGTNCQDGTNKHTYSLLSVLLYYFH